MPWREAYQRDKSCEASDICSTEGNIWFQCHYVCSVQRFFQNRNAFLTCDLSNIFISIRVSLDWSSSEILLVQNLVYPWHYHLFYFFFTGWKQFVGRVHNFGHPLVLKRLSYENPQGIRMFDLMWNLKSRLQLELIINIHGVVICCKTLQLIWR